jgi:Tol biopolymer transport system component
VEDRISRGLHALLLAGMLLLGACTGGGKAFTSAGSQPGTTEATAAASEATGAVHLSLLRGRIAFSGGPAHAEDVYVINADGSDLARVTSDPAADFDPTWSPGGTQLAYRHQPGDDLTTDIYLINADGSWARNLTGSGGVADWGPAWSPDGRTIAWNSDRGSPGVFRGYLIKPDGSKARPLGTNVWVEYPAWSADGMKLAFMGQTPVGTENYEIYVVNADGTNLRRLTDAPGPDGWPAWSPNGHRILFSSVRDDCAFFRARHCKTTGDIGPYYTLYVMNADGTHQRRVSDAFAQIADWSPDGRYIVFDGHTGLSVIRPNGSGLTTLPTGVSPSGFPDWTNWPPGRGTRPASTLTRVPSPAFRFNEGPDKRTGSTGANSVEDVPLIVDFGDGGP